MLRTATVLLICSAMCLLLFCGCTDKQEETTVYRLPSVQTEQITKEAFVEESTGKPIQTDSPATVTDTEPTQSFTANSTEVVETVPGMEIVESTELIVNGNAEIGG